MDDGKVGTAIIGSACHRLAPLSARPRARVRPSEVLTVLFLNRGAQQESALRIEK